MIFNLGRSGGKSGSEQTIGEQTVSRWREASGQQARQQSFDEDFEGVRLIKRDEQSQSRTITLEEEAVEVVDSWQLGDNETASLDDDAEWHVAPLDVEPTLGADRLGALREKLGGISSPTRSTPPLSPTRAPEQPIIQSQPSMPIAAPTRSPVSEPVQQIDQLAFIQQRFGAQSAAVGKVEPKQEENLRAPASDPSLSVEDDLKRRFGANLRSALGAGTVIEGKMSFDSPVRIDGSLNGEVTSTSTLIVGEQASVNADMKVGSVIILGVVQGNIQATDLIEVRRGGRLEGDINAARIMVEDGGFFEGACRQR